MRAVDTNVLVHYYLRNDAAQARVADRILSGGDVFVPKTVMLELEWVLRSVAGESAGSDSSSSGLVSSANAATFKQ